jgi:hypothetical protein
MNKQVFKQSDMTRGFFIETVESVSKEIVNVQPEGFNNTILWHVGYVLMITEGVVAYPHHITTHLPATYIELFDRGTSPTEWKGDVPSVDKLILQLKGQLFCLQQIPSERLDDKLEKPFMGLENFGDFASLVLLHEGIHIGLIEAMKRVVELARFKEEIK